MILLLGGCYGYYLGFDFSLVLGLVYLTFYVVLFAVIAAVTGCVFDFAGWGCVGPLLHAIGFLDWVLGWVFPEFCCS